MTDLEKIKKLLTYTKESGSEYKGVDFDTGYHTLEVDGVQLPGQRKPVERLKNVPYNFSSKAVLDIGSNQGGMLFAVKDQIAEGVGIDYDYKLVNSSNRLSAQYNTNNIRFFVHDVDKDPLNLINAYSKLEKYDIVFLLSICMWVKSWKEVVLWISKNANACLLETNGRKNQQQEQLDEFKKYFSKVQLVNEHSFDDPNQRKRKLYLCEN